MDLRFNMLLKEAGIDPAAVRLLRHQPAIAGIPTADLWQSRRPELEAWQSLQPTAQRTKFTRAHWAAFIGTWDGRTMFAGLYAVGVPQTLPEPVKVPITGMIGPAGPIDHYPAVRSAVLAAYEGRLFIDWGGGPSGKRAWTQRAEAQDKRITELHLDELALPFPGLMELSAPLSSLAGAPPGWIQALSAARGVYLLTCPRDGGQYVGSATGAGGFWSRWAEYRANGHGGNVALIGREPSDFFVCVLEVAGSTATLDDIWAAETRWKRKLQTRGLGLNRN